MAVFKRTNYANVPTGEIDPLWWYNGVQAGSRQAASNDRIGVVPDPNGGNFRVMRMIIHPGDFPNYGGNRCEVLSGQVTLNEGERGQFLFGVMIPTGFKSSSSQWNSLSDWHYPNNGPAQSPFTLQIRSNRELWLRLLAGPISSDGTQGTVSLNAHLYDLAFDKYHDILYDLKQGGTAATGDLNIWVREEGKDPVLCLSGQRPTISSNVNNSVYIKEGFYCSASDSNASGIRTMWLKDTVFWKNSTVDEAYAYAFSGAAPAPGPGPTPTPVEFDQEPTNWIGGRYAVTGSTALGSQIDKQRASRTVVQTTATATGMGVYIEPSTTVGTETVKLAIWPDNGSGTDPGTGPPLAITSEIAISSTSAVNRYSANFVSSTPLTANQIVWRGMINGGVANEAIIRYQTVAGAFRLMAAPYANGPVAWDTANDAAFDIDMVLWITGTPTSGSPPQNISAPIISATASNPVVGNVLLLQSTGQWSSPQPTLTHTWQRDGQGSGSFSDIQTGGTFYTCVTADIGCKIRVFVTATSALGTGTAGSNQLGPITSASVPTGATGRAGLVGHSTVSTRSTTSTRRAYEGGGG